MTFKVILAILTGKFGLYARLLVTDLNWNHQICTKHASLDILSWYVKLGSSTLTFKVILAPNKYLEILLTGIEYEGH